MKKEIRDAILNEIVDLIFLELAKAESQHPGWPEDPVHAAAIIAEEAGEIVKASLDYFYKRSASREEMKRECAQTAAVAIRFLVDIFYTEMKEKEGIN